MQDQRTIIPFAQPVRGSICPPGSKSITNRALACAALAEGTSVLTGALDSDDTRVMIAALVQLGIAIATDEARQKLTVTGCGGKIPHDRAKLFVGNSGTTVRFLTPLVALGQGTYTLDGVPRMRERPIQDLLDALAQLGVTAQCDLGNRCPPVTISARGLRGGKVTIRGDISSQFLSGLLMAAPYAAGPLEIALSGNLVSQPYVRMTLGVMRAFNVDVPEGDLTRFTVPAPGGYVGQTYEIEPDASAASYFWGAAAITGGEITVRGLDQHSLQGDVAFCDCLAKMGCAVTYGKGTTTVQGGILHGIEVNMNAISDTVPTLAAVALFAEGPTTIRGVEHIRHKETDRIAAVATELRKLGATVEEYTDGLKVIPGPFRGASIDTYDDHRMAMSFALVGLKQPGVIINDPGCTSKTYPRFFEDLESLRR
jgi:3-phosphoshikimate 1-carboxyvinyltransferase